MGSNYYFKIVHENKTANKLEAAVLEEIKRYDCLIVNKYWIDCFKATLDEVIQYRASQHPRCKPDCVKNYFKKYNNEDEMLYIGDFVGVRFFQIAQINQGNPFFEDIKSFVGTIFWDWANGCYKGITTSFQAIDYLYEEYTSVFPFQLSKRTFKNKLMLWANENCKSYTITETHFSMNEKKEVWDGLD